MAIDDETLMALADGEITGQEAARLTALIEADAELAARYALFTQTAERARQAARADPEAAVSPDLERRIREMAASAPPEPQNVVPLRRPARRWQPMALAASLALAVGLGAGWLIAPGAPAPEGPVLTADLRDRLGTLPSGAEAGLAGGGRLTMVASFTDGTGAFCREYELVTAGGAGYVSVACRTEGAWDLRFAMARPTEAEGYAPASALETLDAFYAASGASQPLDEAEERAFLE
jgi:anti-sigma factor RsiW